MLKLEKATASQVETDWGKWTKLNSKAKPEKPKSPVITLLESLSDDRFKSVVKVDTEV